MVCRAGGARPRCRPRADEGCRNWARERGFTELASDTEVENDLSLAAHLRFGFFETERLIKFRKPLG